MTELVTSGPMAVAFIVFSDFFGYFHGINTSAGVNEAHIYKAAGGSQAGGHAVLLIGYGVAADTGMKFWSLQNSWGSSWGDNGYFYMKRGVDLCNLESWVVSVVDVNVTAPNEDGAVPTTTTTTTEAIVCEDNTAWRDPWGDSCQWYVNNYHDGICDYWQTYAAGLWDNCAHACSNGVCDHLATTTSTTTTTTPTTTTTTTTTTCVDNALWLDISGDSCSWWAQGTRCSDHLDHGQFTSCPMSCGLCGGSVKTEQARRLRGESALLLKTPYRRMDGQDLADHLMPKATLLTIANQGLGALATLPPKDSFPPLATP